MKAQELRLGNYFIGYDKKVSQWDLACFDLLSNGIEVDEIIQSFVPLTEEWLLKFGFYKDFYSKFLKEVFELALMEQDFANEQYTVQIAHCFCTKIKHVHQLQNLYFALTGEELTIK